MIDITKPTKLTRAEKAEYRRLLKVNDAVTYSAMSRATLYAEMKKGTLRFLKLGHATRIEISELDRWIDNKAGVS